MKKYILLMVCFFVYTNAQAQYFKKKVQPQKDLNVKNRFFVDLNLLSGSSNEQVLTKNLLNAYTQSINSQIGIARVSSKSAIGFEGQLNYFFNDGKSWGVGLGLQYFQTNSELTIDKFHVEYKSVDSKGSVFRQLITANRPIKESLKNSLISIPIVLKYKMDLGDRFGLVVDAGLLLSLSQATQFDANSSFDYEAIYKFQKSGNEYIAVYDNNVIPSSDSWLITKAQYNFSHSDGNVATYFQSLQADGYNVGLDINAKNSGQIKYKSGSLGFIIQPSLTYQYLDFLSVNIGCFYMKQSLIAETDNNALMITEKLGSYNSVLNNLDSRSISNYGFKIGISYKLVHISSLLPKSKEQIGMIN